MIRTKDALALRRVCCRIARDTKEDSFYDHT